MTLKFILMSTQDLEKVVQFGVDKHTQISLSEARANGCGGQREGGVQGLEGVINGRG